MTNEVALSTVCALSWSSSSVDQVKVCCLLINSSRMVFFLANYSAVLWVNVALEATHGSGSPLEGGVF